MEHSEDPLARRPPEEGHLRRRTFAIISHPDAGKTTLTEKLLLYGGAVQLAGAVKSRKNERSTASDWMELERKRGISVSSTVLQFEYRGLRLNLLDTPGHKDFSEDTYRVLTAVDAVVMVLDAAKGIESQTLKLFEICRARQLPIFTFVNKLDQPALEPLAILDELDSRLQLHAYPMNWPLGAGREFKGIYDRASKRLHFFERIPGGAYKAPVTVVDDLEAATEGRVDPGALSAAIEELAVLDAAGEPLELAAVRAGDLTPVFFGSAVNNFGIQLLLDGFLRLAPPPRPQPTASGFVLPEDPRFSAFVFKIQSNMDPKHRDQLAFLRVCSGRFQRDMRVRHSRTGALLRLSSSHKLFGRGRETVDEAYPGDIVGIVGHSQLRIGDTLAEDAEIVFNPVPRFPPEHLAYLHCADTAHSKRFRAGLEHLLQEGVVQAFTLDGSASRAALLGAVGQLQFEVLTHRLKTEYGAESRLEAAPWRAMRWIVEGGQAAAVESALLGGSRLAADAEGRPVALFVREWDCSYFIDKHPDLPLSKLPPGERSSLSL